MRPSLRVLIACLLLGLLASVGSAWLPAFRSSWTSARSTFEPTEWPFPPSPGAPSRPTTAYIDEAALLDTRVFAGGGDGQFIIRSGWPFRCLERALAFTDARPPMRTLPAIWSGLQLPASLRRSAYERLPVRPIALGMAANVLVYSSAALAFVSVAQWCLQRSRATRNRCLVCGYPQRAASAICSECGSASGSA